MFSIWLILVLVLAAYLLGPVLSLLAAVAFGMVWYGTKFMYAVIVGELGRNIAGRLSIKNMTGIWLTYNQFDALDEIIDDPEYLKTIKVIEDRMKDDIIKRYSQQEYDYFIDFTRQMRKNRKDDRTDITDD